jgi:FMN reductase
MLVTAVDGSPTGQGRTSAAVEAVLRGVASDGVETRVVGLAQPDGSWAIEPALDAIRAADAFVFATPVYRASLAAPLKALLDRLPRGMWGETEAPLQGRAVGIVATGASFHHFLALDDLRSVLAGFFAAHVVPPGLYVPRDGYDDEGGLRDEYEALATQQGVALVELARALEISKVLRVLAPQA